ncbi:DUF6265 family protein [Flavobacterium sp. DG1-102-2]|uniref:DUF6265 family protein n=1 Tax=Flavobacterium sp. DG1-102-2 TaxID=3081663 RepID=UPI00294A6BA7|nr:DUF6265 family protein [Flavobacterium sp. DG1-102-2]MDV6170381.1 DUF6265 family protein [Flavobacterium sp. DG1-102-2]
MKRTIILAFTIASLLVSCKKENTSPNEETTKSFTQIKKAEWFIGNWQNTTDEPNFGETWKQANDSVLKSKAYFVKNGQISYYEFVTLVESAGKLNYIVTVPNQNEGEAVSFEMTSANENQLVFENPKHDFPNKIIYNKVGNDSLVAEISGMQDGKPTTQKFAMRKKEKVNEHQRKENILSNNQ